MKAVFGQRGPLHWAEEPSAAHEMNSRKGSAWESAIVKTAQSGDERFVRILREHIAAGVIRSQQAIDALSTLEASS